MRRPALEDATRHVVDLQRELVFCRKLHAIRRLGLVNAMRHMELVAFVGEGIRHLDPARRHVDAEMAALMPGVARGAVSDRAAGEA